MTICFRAATLPAIALAISLLSAGGLMGTEFPKPYDADGQVKFLDQLLAEFSGRIRLLPVDLFEGEIQYRPRAASTDLCDIRSLELGPQSEASVAEGAVIAKYAKADASFERSLFIHTSFNIPGQTLRIMPHNRIQLRGQLLRVSLWIHSKSYRHSLSLMFVNTDGREVEVPVGQLTWEGWRRIDLRLPRSLYQRGKRLEMRYLRHFDGFLIRSAQPEEPGNLAIMIDNLLVLSDFGELNYPGIEILDEWN